MRIFEGAGVASTWHLELPKAINDIDYGALLDVRLTFYYQARFDPSCATACCQHLATLPGFTSRQRAIPLRWIYPDAFFAFQGTGALAFSAGGRRLPEQRDPAAARRGRCGHRHRVRAAGGQRPLPGHPGQGGPSPTRRTATDSLTRTGSSVGAAAGGRRSASTPSRSRRRTTRRSPRAKLDLAPIVNVALILNYTFTPRAMS